MANIAIEFPPSSFSAEQKEYLMRILVSMNTAVSDPTVQELSILPPKPLVGSIYYFNTLLTGITAVGFWGYGTTGWVQLG